jgi:DNA topoisomerase-2
LAETVLQWSELKQTKDLKKKDGQKKTKLTGIPKLDDANDAGGRHAKKCCLILTEGDSAKALAVSGLSVVGRDRYGVFPLKGKLLNVRDASAATIDANAEITCLKQILGLQEGKVYENTDSLRYGRVMFMTDQDHDGSHIKGLLLNLFASFWPSLLKMPGFLCEFVTPIVKVTNERGGTIQSFYTVPEYEAWKKTGGQGKIRYYKGLGTSTAKEAKDYFSNLDRHVITFRYQDDSCEEAIDKAFNKKRADVRKQWLETLDPDEFLEQQSRSELIYKDFIDKELILFSHASNLRAIPCMVDGLKPGQRKILFSCFKRKLSKEIKVAQLAGYVSEHSAYHHGEVSLTGTIVNMAQNFCGANNLNLLLPNGQFGTRQQGGKDSASPRYIFTCLASVTRYLFPEVDDHVLGNLNDDGQEIEPAWYCPIVPMVLINGSSGIGTGYSSSVPNYNPKDVIRNLRRAMADLPVETMVPWYRGFQGTIVASGDQKYTCEGTVVVDHQGKFHITELPVGTWTSDFKSTLDKMVSTGVVTSYRDNSTENRPSFLVTAGSSNVFRMSTSISTANMFLFDRNGKIKKYRSAEELLLEFYEIRLEIYVVRKDFMSKKLADRHAKLSGMVRFLLAVIGNDLQIHNVPKKDILDALQSQQYLAVDGTYDYLLSMPISSLTLEKVDKLKEEHACLERERKTLLQTSPKEMWTQDLDRLEIAIREDEDVSPPPPNKKRKIGQIYNLAKV